MASSWPRIVTRRRGGEKPSNRSDVDLPPPGEIAEPRRLESSPVQRLHGTTGARRGMTMEVETKDCTALSDAELGEMADMCSGTPAGFDIGLLSKQREAWVLITQVRETGKLQAFG